MPVRKSTAKPEKEGKMPESLPLASICAAMEERKEQVHNICKRAGIEPLARGVYPAVKTLLAIKDYFKKQATDVSGEERADRARKSHNEANISEVDYADRMKLLMLKADGRQMWADGMIEMRRALQNLPNFTDRQKREIVEVLQSVKLKEPEK